MTSTTLSALTTIFTPPSSCLAPTYTVGTTPVASYPTDIDGYPDFTVLARGFRSQCYPAGQTLFSPGLVCPSGWTTAKAMRNYPYTTIGCCPNQGSFTIPSNEDDFCLMAPSANVEVTILSAGETSVQTVGTAGLYGTFAAYAISMLYQERDLSLNATTTTTSGPTTPSTTQNTAPATGGLSTGAQAGIGVGVGIAGLLLIAGLLFAYVRRRRAKATSVSKETNTAIAEKQGIDGGSASPNHYGRSELQGNARSELQANTPEHLARSELQGNAQSELQANTPQHLGRAELQANARTD